VGANLTNPETIQRLEFGGEDGGSLRSHGVTPTCVLLREVCRAYGAWHCWRCSRAPFAKPAKSAAPSRTKSTDKGHG